jgi:dihydroorotase
VHSYWGVNPYGCDLDAFCLASGVTTAVDAGSAGPVNFPGFQRFIAEPARTRMLAFVSVSQYGVLRWPGELADIRFADPEGAARIVKEHPEVAAGIKVRVEENAAGEHGREALRLAIQAGEASNSPVMIHIGNSGITMDEIAATLRPGDVITHCFTPLREGIVDNGGQLRASVKAAHDRGVLLDVGHANRHFTFANAKATMDAGVLPDTISTDLHTNPATSAAIDMPATMTKLLALGMSLEQVIAACTVNAAKAIGWQDRLGRIEIGREADLSVLRLVDEPVTVQDCVGAELTASQHIAARWTVRAGEVFEARS